MTFGQKLRREREARGIALEQVATATKIGLRYLEALEANDFESLPGDVFTKGYVRAVAQFIGLDGEALVLDYMAERGAALRSDEGDEGDDALVREMSRVLKSSRGKAATGRRGPVGMILLLLGGVVGIVALAWVVAGFLRPEEISAPGSTVAQRQAATPEPAPSESPPRTPPPTEVEPAVELPVAPPPPPPVRREVAPPPPSGPPPRPEPEPEPEPVKREAPPPPPPPPPSPPKPKPEPKPETRETRSVPPPSPPPPTRRANTPPPPAEQPRATPPPPVEQARATPPPPPPPSRARVTPPPPARRTPPPPPPVAPTSMIVSESGVGTDVVGHSLVGEAELFPVGTEVWFWTRVLRGELGDSIRHVWIHEGREVFTLDLEIGSSNWRTQSRKMLTAGSEGGWTVEARDRAGRLLARSAFVCTSP